MIIFNLNVNGLRAALKNGLMDYLVHYDPDIISFQEVKINDLSCINDNKFFSKYNISYNFADKKGYSGVMIFSKELPFDSQTSFNYEIFTSEGRLIINEYSKFYLINVYFPSGTMGAHRQLIKDEFMPYFHKLFENYNFIKPFLICGDFNIAHQEMDIHNPKGLKNTSGFLPHERAWMSSFLECKIDIFRTLYPEKVEYSWFSYRSNARQNNKGWRIDYYISDPIFFNSFVLDMKIDYICTVSDHLPLILTLKI